jgi:N,N'-diacetyllegionaminate synthase
MKSIRIGNREIGGGQAPFVIAEVGINHNGEIEKAFAMIAEAKAAGADAVKFQTFTAEEFISDPNLSFTYKSQGREVTESMLAMFKRYEFPPEDWKRIKQRCDSEGITFFSTPQNPGDLELLLGIGVPAVKIGSDDFNNLPLIRRYAKTGLPVMLSCGMADLSEVHQSLEALGTLDGYPTVLFLCTSQYPTPPKDANLLKLKTLAGAFPGLILGFSDHTQGPLASSLAVALGAKVFEKHFTLDHDLPGPDHWFSENPAGLREWIASIRTSDTLLGSPLVRPTAPEMGMRTLARRSIVALRDIPSGARLDEVNLGLRRPGDGLPSRFWELLIGQTAVKPIAKGQQIRLGDFS